MNKKISLKNTKNTTKMLNILNFDLNDHFFFRLTNFDVILNNIESLNELSPCDNDIESLKNEIKKTSEIIKENTKYSIIDIIKRIFRRF